MQIRRPATSAQPPAAEDDTATVGPPAPGDPLPAPEGAQGGSRRSLRQRLRVIVPGILAALLVIGTGALVVLVDPAKPALSVALPAPAVFHELPPQLTDIRPGRRPHYVKATVVVEIGENGAAVLSEREPAVVDAIRSLLRDYDRSDLVGEAGLRRLRADVLIVINRVLAPARARRVLFQELLVD